MPALGATARLILETDGRVRSKANFANYVYIADYYYPTTVGIGNSSWAKVTVLSGDPVGTTETGTWVNLNVQRVWSLGRASPGEATSNLLVQVANDPDGANIRSTFNVYMTAEVD